MTMRPFNFLIPNRIFLMTVGVVGLLVWWSYPQGLTSWRSVAIISGWIANGLLLASLLLMIREPWLAAWLGGLEPMYLWHHRLGVAAYLFLLIHPLALAADGGGESMAQAWSTVAPWQQDWPVWLGWASLLCMMLGLAVSLSPRVPYAAWRKLHHLLTLSILIAGAHLLILGLEAPLILAPLMALVFLLWRFFRADYGLAARPFVVTHVAPQGHDMIEVSLQPLTRPMSANPGQFVFAAFLKGTNFQGCGEYHPYSLSAITPNGGMSLGIRALGDCTRHLQSLPVGVAVRVQGPFGSFMANHAESPSLWIAGGIGITPFLAVLRNGTLTHAVQLIYLCRHKTDAAYLTELDDLVAQQPQLILQVVISGEGQPDLEALLPAAAKLQSLTCYLCGPPGLVSAAVRVLKNRGVKAQKIHFERFDFR